MSNYTKYELHKYICVHLEQTLFTFNFITLVGRYEREWVSIREITMVGVCVSRCFAALNNAQYLYTLLLSALEQFQPVVPIHSKQVVRMLAVYSLYSML